MKSFFSLIRAGQPTGFLLLFYPCAFGVLLNLKTKEDLLYIPIFLIGSMIMRSSGCIINDLFDINLDSKVERTKLRPLTSGQISKNKALIWLVILLILGIVVLCFLSSLAIILSIVAFILAIIYPLMKRVTYFSQVFLGITFNTGILIGAATIKNTLSIADWIVYLGAISWTTGYDTIYAFMDVKDDKKIGIKSLALFLLDKNYKLYLGFFYSFFIIAIIVSMNIQNILSIKSIIILLVAYAFLMLNVAILQIDNMDNCLNRFKSNNIIGIMVILSYLIEKIPMLYI